MWHELGSSFGSHIETSEVNKLSFILETGCICNMADELMEKEAETSRVFSVFDKDCD